MSIPINIIISFSPIGYKCNKSLNKYTAKINPIAVVVHKKVLILLNGLQAAITANILTPPIIKYIIVVDSSCDNPNPWPVKVNMIILMIIVSEYGSAFLITVFKKVPLIGFEFDKNDKKNDKRKHH